MARSALGGRRRGRRNLVRMVERFFDCRTRTARRIVSRLQEKGWLVPPPKRGEKHAAWRIVSAPRSASAPVEVGTRPAA
ncbi:MAG: hypothetical protein AAGN82_30875 [Myxococcota bacterium]